MFHFLSLLVLLFAQVFSLDHAAFELDLDLEEVEATQETPQGQPTLAPISPASFNTGISTAIAAVNQNPQALSIPDCYNVLNVILTQNASDFTRSRLTINSTLFSNCPASILLDVCRDVISLSGLVGYCKDLKCCREAIPFIPTLPAGKRSEEQGTAVNGLFIADFGGVAPTCNGASSADSQFIVNALVNFVAVPANRALLERKPPGDYSVTKLTYTDPGLGSVFGTRMEIRIECLLCGENICQDIQRQMYIHIAELNQPPCDCRCADVTCVKVAKRSEDAFHTFLIGFQYVPPYGAASSFTVSMFLMAVSVFVYLF